MHKAKAGMEVRVSGSAYCNAKRTTRKHVLEDLKPYICTFEACSSPLQAFSRRHDFTQHEKNVHGTNPCSLYICRLHECNAVLKGYSAVLKHQADYHANEIGASLDFGPE